MEYVYMAMLALFLSWPVGPAGFTAGERMISGHTRDFVLIGLGCILADVALALLGVMLITMVPEFDPSALYDYAIAWLVTGGALVALGVYLYWKLPERKKANFVNPFLFGFGVTAFWPTSLLGIVGALLAAHVAGWLPNDLTHRLLLAPSLGIGTAVLWLGWAYACHKLRKQKRWELNSVANFFQRLMAGSVALGGMAIMAKPFGF